MIYKKAARGLGVAISVILLLIVTHYSVYSKGKTSEFNRLQSAYGVARTAQLELSAKKLRATQLKLAEIEKDLLNEKVMADRFYKSNANEVAQAVERHVADNSFSDCSIGPSGLLKLNRALSRATETSGASVSND